MNKFSKIISKLFEIILPFVDQKAYMRYNNQPFSNQPKSKLQKYYKLADEADRNTYSLSDVDLLEKQYGFSVDRIWLNYLALHTQIVIKKSELNYAHGRVLYSVLRHYLTTLNRNIKSVNIFETGTARGFSSICMAKALSDSGYEGSICTIDVLPHFKKMFWNSPFDHTKGEQTRQNLLINWANLIERYIIFIQGYTRHIIPKIAMQRINFAFLDGSHTYKDVLIEFNMISKCQKKGDIIIFDDYNHKDFPGIVKIIDDIINKKNYEVKLIYNKKTSRNYAIAKKLF